MGGSTKPRHQLRAPRDKLRGNVPLSVSPRRLSRGRNVVRCVSSWRLGPAELGGREEGRGQRWEQVVLSRAISPRHSSCPRNRPRWTEGGAQRGMHDVLQRKKHTLPNGPHAGRHAVSCVTEPQ